MRTGKMVASRTLKTSIFVRRVERNGETNLRSPRDPWPSTFYINNFQLWLIQKLKNDLNEEEFNAVSIRFIPRK